MQLFLERMVCGANTNSPLEFTAADLGRYLKLFVVPDPFAVTTSHFFSLTGNPFEKF